MRSTKELREEIAAKAKLGDQVFHECGDDYDFTKVTVFGEGLSTDEVAEKFQALQTELKDLKAEYDKVNQHEVDKKHLSDLNAEFNTPDTRPTFPQKGADKIEQKSIGTMIMESGAHKHKGVPVDIDYEVKTLFQTSAGWDPEALRIGRVIEYPVRPLAVVDYIPVIPTTQDTIKYMLESTFTNNAAEAAAGAAVGEAALALTETSQVVEKVGTFIPVTEEQLEDVPAAEAYLNNRLGYMVRARLDSQILNGDGSTPNLKGTLNIGGSLQTQAKGADSTPDAIYKGMDLVRTVGFTEPSVVFSHPTDWQAVRLLTTADGIYIFGSPLDPGRDMIWGVPVVKTTAVVVNTMILGDYAMFSALYLRRGITIEMSSGYDDYFVKGKFAVKATMRCSMVHYRTQAFCTITGV